MLLVCIIASWHSHEEIEGNVSFEKGTRNCQIAQSSSLPPPCDMGMHKFKNSADEMLWLTHI